jgi:hypothetical protein
MNIVSIPVKEMWKIHADSVKFSTNYNEDSFDSEWAHFRDYLRSEISMYWKESCVGDGDFALSDDRGNYWAQSGGIFNPDMITSDFSELINKIIKNSDRPLRWGVKWSVECNVSPQSKELLRGEFLIKNDFLYVAKYKNFSYHIIENMLSK